MNKKGDVKLYLYVGQFLLAILVFVSFLYFVNSKATDEGKFILAKSIEYSSVTNNMLSFNGDSKLVLTESRIKNIECGSGKISVLGENSKSVKSYFMIEGRDVVCRKTGNGFEIEVVYV